MLGRLPLRHPESTAGRAGGCVVGAKSFAKSIVSGTCFYCEQPATLLCDFKFGWPLGGYARASDGTEYAVRAARLPYTCDMPICRDHGELRGSVHVKARRPLGGFDTYDYCPEHRGQSDVAAPVIGEAEAERLRRAVNAVAWRRLARESGSVRLPLGQGELF